MLPFEFTIKGPPVSLQTKKRNRLQSWKSDVKIAAQRALGEASNISADDIAITITYYYEGDTPDVDNIIKPIQDALVGVCYNDDNQIKDTRSRKKRINGSYKIRNASAVILNAFAEGDAFLHIRLCKHEETEELD